MATDDPKDGQPAAFSIDIGEILRSAGAATRKRSTSRTRRTSATGGRTASAEDAAMRRAVRLELNPFAADMERAIRDLAEEVGRLRKANDDIAAKIDRLTRR